MFELVSIEETYEPVVGIYLNQFMNVSLHLIQASELTLITLAFTAVILVLLEFLYGDPTRGKF